MSGDIDYFVAGTFFDENGWRDHSESNSKQLFGKLGWHGEKTDLNLTYAWADTDLNGNGLTPQSMLRANYDSVFTWPDNTQNKSNFLNLQLANYFTSNVSFTGNTYYRKIKTRSYNGDLNDGALPEEVGGQGQNVLTAAKTSGCTVELAKASGGEPLEKCTGLINRGEVNQENMGLFGQVNVSNKLWDLNNTYSVGGGVDFSRIISSPTSGEGYFKNFGETRRRGVEGGINAQFGDLGIGANYTFLDATYQSNETFMAEANSSADNGNVNVKKGNRIPLIPRNMFKLYSIYRVTERLSVGADLQALAGSYTRGDENNKHESGGSFLGRGMIAGYTTVNLSAAFQINNAWNVFARVNNVFDKEYATAGQLGASPFNPSTGSYMIGGANGRRSMTNGETFLAPGALRSAWVGVRYEFGGKKSAYVSSAD